MIENNLPFVGTAENFVFFMEDEFVVEVRADRTHFMIFESYENYSTKDLVKVDDPKEHVPLLDHVIETIERCLNMRPGDDKNGVEELASLIRPYLAMKKMESAKKEIEEKKVMERAFKIIEGNKASFIGRTFSLGNDETHDRVMDVDGDTPIFLSVGSPSHRKKYNTTAHMTYGTYFKEFYSLPVNEVDPVAFETSCTMFLKKAKHVRDSLAIDGPLFSVS